MPTPREYVAKDGTTTWRVRYRDTHNRSCSTTLATEEDANWFASTIDTHGVPFALAALKKLIRDTSASESPALSQVFEEYITDKARNVRSDRTIGDYRRQYDETIHPTLGSLPVADIDAAAVGAWVDALKDGKITSRRTKKPFSPKSIAHVHAVLYGVMEYATDPRRGYITANPCSGTKLPDRMNTAPKGLMPAEWQALHAALTVIDTDAADLAAFLIGTGWRWSEAAALTPAAVEDYGTAVHVTMMQVARRGGDGVTNVVPDGKAKASIRRVKLDPDTAAIVRKHIVGKGPEDPVFTEDGTKWTYKRFYDRFTRAGKAAGLSRRPTPHWLRHSHVVWMVMSGAPLPEIQARIGHASIQTTIGVYGRLLTDVNDDTLTAFAAMRSAGMVATPGVAQPLPPGNS